MGARGRPWSGGRRVGSGGNGKAGGGSPRGGPRSRHRLHPPQRFRPRPPDSNPGGGSGGSRPHSFFYRAGGPSLAAEAAGPAGSPGPAVPVFFSPPGGARAARASRLQRRWKPGTLLGAEPRVCGGRAPWPPLYRARRRGEALAEAPAAPSGSRKPDPAPRPGRGNFHSRRYLVTRPRCHPSQSEECELSEC